MDQILAKTLAPPLYEGTLPHLGFRARLGFGFKRAFDIFASALGLLLLAPFFAIIAILVKRDSPGPAFYWGWRAGRGGRDFKMLKFRTMVESPASYKGPKVTSSDDPRITPIGRWLRDSKLNELPQLWNVLIGDMSLVGPRPEDPDIAALWSEDVRRKILVVRPGITSPASILYRNEESMLRNGNVMETYLNTILPTKLRLDELYFQRRSFWLDLDIIIWTLWVLLPGFFGISPTEDNLFWGPISRLVRRHLSWTLVDALIAFGAMALANAVWLQFNAWQDTGFFLLAITFCFVSVFGLGNSLIGVNRIAWFRATPLDALGLMLNGIAAGCFALFINEFGRTAPLVPVGLVMTTATFAILGFVVARHRSQLSERFSRGWLASNDAKPATQHVLIVGSGYTAQHISWMLNNGNWSGAFQLVGFVDDDLYKQGMRLNGAEVIGRLSDIPRLVKHYEIGVLVIAVYNLLPMEYQHLIQSCASTGVRVIVATDVWGALNNLLQDKALGAQATTHCPEGELASLVTPCDYCPAPNPSANRRVAPRRKME